MKRRWFFSLFAVVAAMSGQDRIGKHRAVELAAEWARRNHGGLGRGKSALQFDKAEANEASWKNDHGESRPVWFVHFPERQSKVEPSGLAVRVDRETGKCERAVLE
ncbi:MAG: hypothetical protein SGI92_28700 [Bryobacteraceae bacterium]|nr:hypothetical protein [Bryobacteraceae bacterium]